MRSAVPAPAVDDSRSGVGPAPVLWLPGSSWADGLDLWRAARSAGSPLRLVLHVSSPEQLHDTGPVVASALTPGEDAADVALTVGAPRAADVAAGQHLLVGAASADVDAPAFIGTPNREDFLAVLRALGRRTSRPRRAGTPEELIAAGQLVGVRIMGGLGNQLFQYATARALADRTGSALVVDRSWFTAGSSHEYGLDAYHARIDAVVHGAEDWSRLAAPPLREHVEERHDVDTSVLQLEPGVVLTGYYQSERYFADDEVRLRSDLRLREPLSAWAQQVADTARGLENPLSLHVRRGDYVANPEANAVHGTCTAHYYRRAVSLVRRLEGDVDVLTFSDDPAWAAEHVTPRDTRSSLTLDPPPGSSAAENLHLLSLVRHSVVANSTFSWWGAWLREHPGTTIAPRPWFRRSDLDPRDLLPRTWITVDSR